MKLQSAFIAPILIVAYSYMALVPIIQPVVLRAMTTRNEREIAMNYSSKGVSTRARILFPIIITIISGLIAPESIALVGMLIKSMREYSRL